MAIVYLASDLKHGRRVAVKVLRPELAADLGSERFLREIRIAAQLQHPHILPLFDSGLASGEFDEAYPYYIMPYVEGESLRERLQREGRLPVDVSVRLACEVAGALAHAHGRGIVHRDVKPENIHIDAGHAIVADFGIARAISAAGGDRVTSIGLVIGTPVYMSPEQAMGADEIDGRSDQYSLACVLYEMLTGEPPFAGQTLPALLARRFTTPPRPLRSLRPEAPAAVEATLARALAPEPGERFRDAGEFRDALAVATTGSAPAVPIGAADRRRRLYRRAGLAAGAALALTGAYLAFRPTAAREAPVTAAAPASNGIAIAVLPFDVRGGSEFDYLSTGMVDLLSTTLDGAGELRSVDPRALLSATAQGGDSIVGPDRGREIAERFGAGLYVLGDVVEAGGRLQLSAALYRPGGDAPVTRAAVQGDATKLFDLVDSLAAQLLTASVGEDSRITRLAARTTHSLPALKAYLDGENALRSGHFDAAMTAFGRALDADSSFALAWYRLSVAAEWLLRPDVARTAAERAVRLSARLPSRDSVLLEAMLAGRRGGVDRAEPLYRTITGTYPEDVEAWLQLAELLFHFGPWSGRSMVMSREAWERVLEYEPDLVMAKVHLARIAARQGRYADLDVLVREVQEARRTSTSGGTDESRAEDLELRALRAFAVRDTAAQSAILTELRNATDLTTVLALWSVVSYTDEIAGGLRIAPLLTAPERAPRVRAVGHVQTAYLQAARGRWRDARRELAAAEALDPVLGRELGVLLELAPFRSPSRGELAALRDRIASMSPADTTPPLLGASAFYTVPYRLTRQLSAYLLGVTSAGLGDAAAARRHATELARLHSPPSSPTLAADLARGVRAQIAWHRGDADSALAELDWVRLHSWYIDATSSPAVSGSRERFLRAEALARLGRNAEALRWFNSFGEISAYENAYLAPAERRMGQICEALGRRDEAVRHYSRFVALWRDADPELQPIVQEARGRLAALEAGTRDEGRGTGNE